MSLFRRWQWPHFSQEEIRKRSRILVIDDDDFFYRDLFQRDGYNLDKWDDVRDLQKLEDGYYDLLLLDIQGVGTELSKDQGLGVLRHLKGSCPSLLVIAYSNADYSLKYKEFFDLADAALAKADDYVLFKRAVDELLQRRFSLDHYLRVATDLAASPDLDTGHLRKLLLSSIRTTRTDKLERFLQRNNIDRERVSLVLNVVQTAAQILALAVA